MGYHIHIQGIVITVCIVDFVLSFDAKSLDGHHAETDQEVDSDGYYDEEIPFQERHIFREWFQMLVRSSVVFNLEDIIRMLYN